MPTLSIFEGIFIRMFYEGSVQHHAPHFHAAYGEYEATLRIPDGKVLAGSLPRRKMKLVQAWLILREKELAEAWEACRNNEPPSRIEPLR